MTRATRQAVTQSCPNCGKVHDVAVYVSGQQLACTCGIRFEVRRTDVRNSTPSAVSTLNERKGVDPIAVFDRAAAVVDGLKGRDAERGAAAQEALSEAKVPAATGTQNGNGAAAGSQLPSSVPIDLDLSQPRAAASPLPLALDKTISSRPEGVPGIPTHDGQTRVGHRLEVPGYELLELLGKGGMGEVWRAKQLSLNRMVAVKVLPQKFAEDREFISRFDKEATALASLSHPNIVQIIDRGHAGEHYYFAMELVPGINLREKMASQTLTARDALKITVQVAHAIDYAHEQRIVHRDLKPENILLDARGHVKIADFGLAGMQGSEHNISLTATAVAMGTVNYMAPEQRRDAKHVDHRADLYSMGVLLYEMLTGELPLGRFKLPSEKMEGLDVRLDEIVAQLLETEPAQRPHRASDVARALEELIPASQGPTAAGLKRSSATQYSAKPGSAVQQPGGTWKVAVFVLGGMLVFAGVLKYWPVSTPPTPQRPAWYQDTEDELYSSVVEANNSVKLDFEPVPPGPNPDEPAGEQLNAHCGVWKLSEGSLSVVQWGDPTDLTEHTKVVPRAYVAHRYFSADDFDAEVLMDVEDLGKEFPPVGADEQRYAELGFRIKDLQVSIFAIPDTGMRLMWRYFTPEGKEIVGNSAIEIANMVEDEMRVPTGRFKVRLKLQRQKSGVISAEAFVNNQRFYHKLLEGLSGQTGKITLGCRNLSCQFDDLSVRGKPMPRPGKSPDGVE